MPKHWLLYERQTCRAPGLTPGQIVGRLALIGLGGAVVALLGPFMPSLRPRHHLPATFEEYLTGLLFSGLFALLLAWGAVSEYIGKPLKNKRLGYQLVGRFTVLGKQKLFGKAWLELEPDDTHRVEVTGDLFGQFQKGDVVEVAYSATHDLISLRSINPRGQRP